MKNSFALRSQRGNTLIFAVPMAALLLFSTFAYLKWQVSAQFVSRRQVAVIQAYYTAQAAVISIPLAFMRSQRPGFSLTGDVHFENGTLAGIGRYLNPTISYTTLQGIQAGQLLQNRDYLLSATGIATVYDFQRNPIEVKRKAILRIRKKSFQQYFYFTDVEQTRFNEMIWFTTGDTLYGPVHSNTSIGIQGPGVFRGFVTTHDRIIGISSGQFLALPAPGYREHVRRIDVPNRADLLREGAARNGGWLDSQDNTWTFGLIFNNYMAYVYRWQTGSGTTFTEANRVPDFHWTNSLEFGIFCTGDLWIKGVVSGKVGIGAAGNIRLMDNLVYSDVVCQSYPYNLPPILSTNAVTIISEAAEPQDRMDPWTGILIANTWENGREDGMWRFPSAAASQGRRDIAIYGQLIALNSSFTFQEHNDNEGYETYVWEDPNRLDYDERGYIYLRGAVTQHRRGYVHRGNTQTTGIRTGYFKSYQWDPRWDTRSGNVLSAPPFQIDVTDLGYQKWDVLGWEDLPRKVGDE